MEDHKVLIISDSRGSELQDLLNEQPSTSHSINWTVNVNKGATINTISRKIDRIHHKYNVIIVIAGICNFTCKRKSTRNTIDYPERRKDTTIREIDTLLEKYPTKVHICTITPADLIKRQDPDSTITEEIQENLVQDITETNDHIKSKNIDRDFPTIDLANNSHTHSLKRQGGQKKRIVKFTSKDLPDGIHPSLTLKQDWARYIAQTTPKIINKLEEKLNQDSSQSEDETWRFKRQRCGNREQH